MSDQALQKIREALQKSGTTKQDIMGALGQFGKKRILLVGDLIIDIYTHCTAIGKTAKTPTLSVKRGESKYYWGGSSLIANNLLAMGGNITFVAVTGDDSGYDYFTKRQHDKLQSKFFKDKTRPTTVKERFWVDGYKLLQVDTVENHDIPQSLEDEIFGFLEASIDSHDLFLIADNRHGTMTSSLIRRLKKLTATKKKPLVVDTQVSSRWGNLEEYADVGIICVNEHESRFFLRDEKCPVEEVRSRLVKILRPQRLIIKQKERGMVGWDKIEGDFSFPAFPVQSVDPIGAGDAFLSAASLSFDPTVKLFASIFLACCSGAIAVTKMGTDPTTFDEIRALALEYLEKVEVA